MKCANCGAEIRVGCVYCPVCGKEAQIVSDYNILEDDYLDSLLQEGEKPSVPSKSKQKEKAAKPKQEKPTGKKSKKSLYIVFFILLFVAAFALIGQTYSASAKSPASSILSTRRSMRRYSAARSGKSSPSTRLR